MTVDIDSVAERKWRALDCHESQFYEWLAYNMRPGTDNVPTRADERLLWLQNTWSEVLERPAESCRQRLIETYGSAHGMEVTFAEAFELSEFGSQPGEEELRALFPGQDPGED